MSDICPACKRPVSSHELYKDGRCPVIVFRGLEAEAMVGALKRRDVRAVRAIAAASPTDEQVVASADAEKDRL